LERLDRLRNRSRPRIRRSAKNDGETTVGTSRRLPI
jgi:hypothetical protein